MPRALLIVNRFAREGNADLEKGLEILRGAGFSLREVYPEEDFEVADILDKIPEPLDLVIIGGGDGTLNSAARAVVERALPLGILPMGTANDLARTLGIPARLEEACRVIAAGRPRPIDLGCVNGRFFFNVASFGLSTSVTQNVTSESKRRWGALAYLRALLRAMVENRSFLAEIRCDHRVLRHRSIQISVANGRHYGGGMVVAEDAAIDDGRLHLFSLEPQSPWQLLRLAPALRRGAIAGRERILLLSGQTIEVRTRSVLPIDTDGELTTATPARFDVVPAALSVFCPPPDLRSPADEKNPSH